MNHHYIQHCCSILWGSCENYIMGDRFWFFQGMHTGVQNNWNIFFSNQTGINSYSPPSKGHFFEGFHFKPCLFFQFSQAVQNVSNGARAPLNLSPPKLKWTYPLPACHCIIYAWQNEENQLNKRPFPSY